jgi:hypothetical protein
MTMLGAAFASAAKTRGGRVRVARWLLAAAIFGSTMAIGAVHTAVLVPVTLLLLGSAVLVFFGADPLRGRRSASLVLWTGVLLTAWTALSLVPLPMGVLGKLSPHAADVWSRCLAPLGEPGPSLAPLTLDPGATRVQVLRGIAYCLAFVAASRISARREGVVFLERALVVTAVTLAVAALIHPMLGVEKVFGLYTPRRDPGIRHMAPILNPNVLSGYLNVGLAVLLGQLFLPRSVWPRTIVASLSVALIGAQIWIASRGGVLGCSLAIVLVIVMSRWKGPESHGLLMRALVPGVLMVSGIVAWILASSEGAMDELATLETSKLDIAKAALRIIPDFPVFGVGRGAFESVFPAYRTDPSFVVYTHPENVVAQWLSEWGLPAAIAMLVLVVALQPATALARSPRAIGPWAALAAVSVSNLVDFGSEYPAVILALTTCAAIVTGGTSGTAEKRTLDAWGRRPLRLVVVMVAVTGAGLLLLFSGDRSDVFEDRVALRAAALDPHVSRADFDARARAAIERHPAEPYLPFMGALYAARTKDSSLLPWIERTLDRALVYGPAHLLLARWLTTRSPSQARLEYRLTLDQSPELGGYVSDSAPALVHGYDDALEIAPVGAGRTYWVGILASSVAARLPATAWRLDDLAAQLDPSLELVAAHRADAALSDVLHPKDAPWCADEKREDCIHDALLRAAVLIRVDPSHCSGHAIRARLLVESGDPAQALKGLAAAADTVSDRTYCYKQLASLAGVAKSNDVVDRALDRVVHAGCADTVECVGNLEFVSDVELARGNERSAFAALKRALALAPEDDVLAERTAQLAGRIDLHAEAIKIYHSLASRHPSEPRWPAAISGEREALLSGATSE